MADPALAALRDDVVAKLDGLAGLRSKGMFGGYGLWAEEGLFFGIVDDGNVYFRTDAQTRPGYDAARSTGFRYAPGEPPSDTYRSVPAGVLADPATLLAWAEDAVDASRRAKTPKARRGRS
jgi:TfoX/Sxy family transcriptional regulator of competence genes